MFYNGIKKYCIVFVFKAALWYHYVIAVNYNFSKSFSKLGLNDSLALLSLVSSPVFTIIILLSIVAYLSILKLNTYTYSVVIVFACISTYFLDFNCNLSSLSSTLGGLSFNLNLQNGLLNIHPFLVYAFYGWIYVYIWIIYFKRRSYKSKHTFNTSLVFATQTILVGVILGSWWASQELNWGGYWSWDPVELISLVLLLFLINLAHNQSNIFRRLLLVWYINAVVILYFIMRLGVVVTIHSFVKNTNLPQYVYMQTLFVSLSFFLLFRYRYVLSKKAKSLILNYSVLIITINLFLWGLLITLINLILTNLEVVLDAIIIPLDNYYSSLIIILLLVSILTYTTIPTSFFKFQLLFLMLLTTNYVHLVWGLILFRVLALFSWPTYKSFHFILFWGYVSFLLYFVQILTHLDAISNYFALINMCNFGDNTTVYFCYENNFSILKKNYLISFKSFIHHIPGFSVYSNLMSTSFFFSKNSAIYSMFSEEVLFLSMYITMFSVYLYVNNFNKSKFLHY